ncbi:MAG: isochorismatase family cysteine hydrolase [Desulfurococcaceae archaeon]
MKPVLLVIDMLEEFVRGRLRSPEAEVLIPRISLLLREARRRGILVVYVIDQHIPYDREIKIWGSHAMAGSSEAAIVKELEPTEKDIVLFKRSYSGFRDTGLDQILRGLGIDTVILTGIHTHICILHTAWDAFYLGYNIIVVKDAVAAFTKEDHEYALKYMEKVYGAKIVDYEELIGLLEKEIG